MSAPAVAAQAPARVGVSFADAVVPAALVALAVGSLAAAQGGYFAPSWNWAATAFAWTAAVAVFARSRFDWGPFDVAVVLGLVALTAWTALSLVWSEASHPAVLEIQRTLVYLTGVAAVLAVGSRRSTAPVLAGLLVAIAGLSAYALATRLFPDRLGVFDPTGIYRLSEPIGYWNGLGLFTAIGTVLAFAFATRSRAAAARLLAGAALPVLLCTTYFTFGRAALLALPFGLVAMTVLDPRRLEALAGMLVLAPASAVAVWIASREEGLTRQGADLTLAADDGRRVAIAVVVLAAASGCAAVVFEPVARRVTLHGGTRRILATTLAVAPLVVLVAFVVRLGGPVATVDRVVDEFRAPPPATIELNERLQSFSANGRIELWGVAWDEFGDSPAIGNGAGSFERAWLEQRPMEMQVRDAHGLYVETLGELGVVGLLLLVFVLSVPAAAAVKARAHPLVPAAFGAYAAYLLHAGADWDWELSGVTLAALVAACAIILAARPERSLEPPAWLRAPAIAVALAVGGLAVGALVGNAALDASDDARQARDFAAGQADARTATSWMPWSGAPWLALGELQLLAGDRASARASLREGVSRDPHDWRLWYHLALAADAGESRAALANAERLNPRSSQVDALRAELAQR